MGGSSGKPGGSGGGGSATTPITTNNAMGSALTISAAPGSSVFDGTLSAALCTISFDNFVNGIYSEILVRLHQDGTTPNRDIAVPAIFGNYYAPVMPGPISSVMEFWVSSLTGNAGIAGGHGQKVRTHSLPSGDADTVGNWLEYIETDSRIVKVRPSCGGVPSGSSALWDLFRGVGQGAPSTLYTTTGNRPTVSVGNRTNTSVTLPDSVKLAAGDYLRGDVVTRSSATGMSLMVTTVES